MAVLRFGRALVVPAADSVLWVGALAVSCALRYEFDLSQIDPAGLLAVTAVAVAAQLVLGSATHLYRGRHRLGSLDDASVLTTVVLLVGALVFALNLELQWVPRAVPLIATLVAATAAGALRLAYRKLGRRRSRPNGQSAQRVIVFGAGQGGQQLMRSMQSDPDGGYLPVAVLDDARREWGRRVAGVVVRGGRAEIAGTAAATRADLLVIAVPSADAALVHDVAGAAIAAGVGVKVLPPLSELFRPWVGLSDLRDLDISDLLGRRQVETDVAGIAGALAGKRVLVTGAGGSIGSELCRQLQGLGPAELIMLDRDESALHAVQLSIRGRALLDTSDVILADIRDQQAITEIFARRRPHVVFHAAALKHLPMLEQYPQEAWKSNVLGTVTVLEAAAASGVETFVNISTDKAANPTSVLGRSKRIGERLVAEAATEGRGRYLSVRFGNVLGSRGSVVTTFVEQITTGRPITVTHPDVTRYFMTIPEAVQLVLQAAVIGAPGEVLVLDMGEPVPIVTLARQLMELAGRTTTIVYTGLRTGEKLHEELFGIDEPADIRPLHPAISHAPVPPLGAAWVREAGALLGPVGAMESLTDGELLDPLRPVGAQLDGSPA